MSVSPVCNAEGGDGVRASRSGFPAANWSPVRMVSHALRDGQHVNDDRFPISRSGPMSFDKLGRRQPAGFGGNGNPNPNPRGVPATGPLAAAKAMIRATVSTTPQPQPDSIGNRTGPTPR
jgi:hypothetical protein